MKIYGSKDNVHDAVDAVVENCVAVVTGTKTQAVNYANRIIKCLSPYSDIVPSIGYQNVPHDGYLYYVYDLNRYSIGSEKLKNIIFEIDRQNT